MFRHPKTLESSWLGLKTLLSSRLQSVYFNLSKCIGFSLSPCTVCSPLYYSILTEVYFVTNSKRKHLITFVFACKTKTGTSSKLHQGIGRESIFQQLTFSSMCTYSFGRLFFDNQADLSVVDHASNLFPHRGSKEEALLSLRKKSLDCVQDYMFNTRCCAVRNRLFVGLGRCGSEVGNEKCKPLVKWSIKNVAECSRCLLLPTDVKCLLDGFRGFSIEWFSIA